MDLAADIAASLGDDWLPRIYETKVRSTRTRSLSIDVPSRENNVTVEYTLLGIEVKVGKSRFASPDLATARYMRIFARLGCGEFAIPYDITKISPLADELETSWQRILLLIEENTRGKTDRAPRFGEIRLELGIDRLVSEGWIMLSDFIQRDYPTLVAPADRPDLTEHKAKSDQRDLAAKQAGHKSVREFRRGQIDGEDMMNSMTAFQHITDPEQKQALTLARQFAHMVPGDEMVYGPEKEVKRPELLHKNILAGADIVPGLVERAIVEIIRFEQANPPLAQRLKAMSGAELMDFLLRDLLRPQAMLPNSVDLSNANVTRVKGKG